MFRCTLYTADYWLVVCTAVLLGWAVAGQRLGNTWVAVLRHQTKEQAKHSEMDQERMEGEEVARMIQGSLLNKVRSAKVYKSS